MTDTTELIAAEPATDVEMIELVATEETDEKELAERLLAQARGRGWGILVAASGEISWPPLGRSS